MANTPTASALLLTLLIGILIGSVVGAPLTTGEPPSVFDRETPPTSYSYSTSCYDSSENSTGWLHVVANGKTWTTTLNATLVHPRGAEIALTVSKRPTGTYEIAFTTGELPSPSTKSTVSDNCQEATTLDVATALPEPALVITVNGRTVRSVTQEETIANLYPLPNPINATT